MHLLTPERHTGHSSALWRPCHPPQGVLQLRVSRSRPAGLSTLELRLLPAQPVTAYEIVSADDWPARDPRSWSLWGRPALMPASTAAAASSGRGARGDGRLPSEEGEWQLLDSQAPFHGQPPARLSSFGRLHLASAAAAPLRPSPRLNRARHGGKPPEAAEAAEEAAPLYLFDAAGESSPLWRDAASLDDLEGQLAALQPSAALVGVDLYEGAAFNGRATRVAFRAAGVRHALPGALRHSARSLRLLRSAEAVTLLYDLEGQGGPQLAPLPRGGPGPGSSPDPGPGHNPSSDFGPIPSPGPDPTGGGTRHRLVLRDAAELRGDVVGEAVVGAPIAAACLGAAVRALLLYDGYGFTGRATVLWHARAVRAATATTAATGSGSGNGAGGGEEGCVCSGLPFAPRAMRVLVEGDALLIRRDGTLEVARASSAGSVPASDGEGGEGGEGGEEGGDREGGGRDGGVGGGGEGGGEGSGGEAGGAARRDNAVVAVCGGGGLRGIELFTEGAWQGRSVMVQPTQRCAQRVPASLLRAGGVRSYQLHRRAESVALEAAAPPPPLPNRSRIAPSPRCRRVLGSTASSLTLPCEVAHVRLGASVRAVSLYAQPHFAGERLFLARDAAVAAAPDVVLALPARWRSGVRSVVLHRGCRGHGQLCPTDAAGMAATRVLEQQLPKAGEVLAFRTQHTPPRATPASLAAHGTFHVYNPSLVAAVGGGAVSLVVRIPSCMFHARLGTIHIPRVAARSHSWPYPQPQPQPPVPAPAQPHS